MTQQTAARSRRVTVLGAFLSLTSAQLISTAAGFVFWLVTARVVDPVDLGVAAAGLAAVALLSKVTTVGLGTLLVVELPPRDPGEALRILRAAVLLLVGLGAAAGLLCVLASDLLLSDATGGPLAEVLTDPWLAGLFVAIGGATTAANVLDQAVVGVARGGVQVTRNTVASLGRFPVLVGLAVAGDVDAAGVLLTWLVPLLLSLVVALAQLRPPVGTPRGGELRLLIGYWRSALAHHALSLALASGPLIVPVVAGATLTSVENAHFTVAWMIATFVFIPPYMLATALFASSASRGIDQFATSMRRTLPAGLLLSGVLCLGTFVGGGLLTSAFGSTYGANSRTVLGLLALGGLWMVVKDHLVAQYRVQGRLGFATGLAIVSVLMEAAGAAIGGHLGGATGIALGWLGAAVAQAVVGAPIVLGLLRLAREAAPALDEPDPDARPLVVSNGLVADPVEGTQVVARQVADHLVAAHGAHVVVPPDAPAVPGLDLQRTYTRGWVPVRAVLGAVVRRPSRVVVVPDGGIDYRKLLHAWLIGLAAWRKVDLVAVQRHREIPRPIARITRSVVRVVVASDADRVALERSGFEVAMLTPSVDPSRVSPVGRAEARAALGLDPTARWYLHVGHARLGRNLTALAPLASGGGRVVLVISPFSQIEPGALPVDAEGEDRIVVVHERVEVATFYRAADAYVFPTYDAANVIAFPMSIAEALANGLPVVARRTPMTLRWDGHPAVTLVDSDEDLVAAARAAEAPVGGAADPGAALPFGTCTAACRLV